MRNGAKADPDVITRMSDAVVHRGPDDSGVYFSGPIGMGFRRLSILDLSPSGHQPMRTEDGTAVVVFNGEIYNYVELRQMLEARGHCFTSTGDTEVLLRAYLEWGTDCVRRFNGMWAFVIHDVRRGVLFGSRDRFGIKPLYYHVGRDFVLLASEIKSIGSSGLYRRTTNWRRASRFLVEGQIDETNETFYAGIEQVLPGTAFEVGLDGEFKRWQFWRIDETCSEFDRKRDPAETFADLFKDAVRLHTRSDVPVGVHLSGGLDSTSIICEVARLRNAAGASDALMAFSYIAQEFDESRYIEDTIAQTGATLFRLSTSPSQLWGLLGEVLWHQDEPIYSMMPLVGYELMRLTADKGIKVILNGQGADETIGGYPSYFSDYWCSLLQRGHILQAWREVGEHAAEGGGRRSRVFLRQMRRVAQSKLRRFAPYRHLSILRQRRDDLHQRWFTRQLMEQIPDNDGSTGRIGLNEALLDSIYRTPLPRILRVEDRNAMAHSIESRLPFLDYRLVSFAFALELNWHLRGPWNKYVLRQAMRGRIPESVRTRVDKMGFPVPANRWIADSLCEPVLDLVTSRAARERGIYNIDTIVHDVARHRRGEVQIGDSIFDVAQFEVWSTL